MKTKLVIWGTNAQDEKILIAMQLKPAENQVGIWTFPESVATEEFANQMLNEWRLDQEVPLPEPNQYIERELTVTESLLPDDLRVERTDLIQRAQTEWHFIVLSSKLNTVYQTELEELRERISSLEKYDGKIWDSLKEFWSKVQTQVRDKNLFREHADSLRDSTNELFARMKELRARMDEEFTKQSKQTMESFLASLAEVEERIKEGLRLQGLFDELKKMQRTFRDAKLTREHRSKIWERLDAAFKEVKLQRFGKEATSDNSPLQRLNRRYEGLLSAIEKMERSIQRDRDDLNFQRKKIASTAGQLEAQIREAKIKMIEERINSKEEKLGEMNETRSELENRLKSLKDKEAHKVEQEKVEAAREAAKEKIAEQIKQQNEALKDMSDDIEKAAESIKPEEKEEKGEKGEKEEKGEKGKKGGKGKDSMLQAIGATLSESLEDVVDTIKAVAEVVGDRIEEQVDELRHKLQDEEE